MKRKIKKANLLQSIRSRIIHAKHDILFWADTFVRVKTKQGEVIPLKLDSAQRSFLLELWQKRKTRKQNLGI